MQYPRFVALRAPVWEDFEARLGRARGAPRRVGYDDLEALAFGYRQVLHDHALAAARYPQTSTARRLRRLALEGTHWLQQDDGQGRAGLARFFFRTFPRAFRRNLPVLLTSIGLFVASGLLGFTIAEVEPVLGLTLLGPQAVEGLRNGHLWTESLVSTVPPAVSSSGIATNNMGVALIGWAGGALCGLGALYVVLLNGFLLGAVLGTTLRYAMAGELLGFVAGHGPLEITLILLTAAAGLGLGRALVAAADRPRREVLHEASRDAVVLLFGALPWFVVLALVEALVSPAPAVPVPLKAALGLGLEALFLLWAWNPLLPREVE
jgi:uncharacterized membrane protein SpoIIM required for sporulation